MPEHTVVLLHGWPGISDDFDAVRAELEGVRVLAPDLLGFGSSFRGELPLDEATGDAHARRLLARLDELGLRQNVVVGGYDLGSRISQLAIRLDPSRFAGAVITPGYPGTGDRALLSSSTPQFWYQQFHREHVATELIDGNPDAVRVYLSHIWNRWSGSSASLPAHFDRLVTAYARPGAFAASVQWYHANQGFAADLAPIEIPVRVVWPAEDPLFPLEWADRLGEHFTDFTLREVTGSGHFVPVEAPAVFADAVRSLLPVPGVGEA